MTSSTPFALSGFTRAIRATVDQSQLVNYKFCFQGPFPTDHNCYDMIILARYTSMQQSKRLLDWITSHKGFKKTFEGKKTTKENWHSALSVNTCKFLRRSRASDDKTLASIICLRSSASLSNHHHHIEHVQHRTSKLQP